MRNAAAQLLTRKRLDRDIFARGMPEGVKTIRTREHSAEIYDLLKAYAEQRTRTTVRRAHVVKKRTVWSIKDARQRLKRRSGAPPVRGCSSISFSNSTCRRRSLAERRSQVLSVQRSKWHAKVISRSGRPGRSRRSISDARRQARSGSA
jgi:chromatin segregation and condensation protein Rec8/ScpA/Scc1 (kleisin family)